MQSAPIPAAPDLAGFAPVLHEVFAAVAEAGQGGNAGPGDAMAHPGLGGAPAAMLALVLCGARAGPLLWVQQREALALAGRPYPPGLPAARAALVHVVAPDAAAALWAMEEGLCCDALAGVVGEIAGDPAALGFTASRRLAVAAERHGVPCVLLRLAGRADLSGARQRWRVAAAPSRPHCWDARAPGSPGFRLELFRSRTRPPGQWEGWHERAGPAFADPLPAPVQDRLHLAAGPARRTVGDAAG